MTIAEFLLARLSEDEAAARDVGADAMTGHRWKHAPENVYQELQATVLANSRRVLREVEAKRAIVEVHQDFVPSGSVSGRRKCETCAENVEADFDGTPMVEWPCPTLRHLSAIYSDHPEFDAGWAP